MKLDLDLANKILDLLNKNQKDEDFLDASLEMFKNENIQLNLMSYNMIMDFYCSLDQFSKAKEIFNQLIDQEMFPDAFSYSILIKGLKKSTAEDCLE